MVIKYIYILNGVKIARIWNFGFGHIWLSTMIWTFVSDTAKLYREGPTDSIL